MKRRRPAFAPDGTFIENEGNLERAMRIITKKE